MAIASVLMIDDESDIRTIGELSLSSLGGWKVLLAERGRQGIAIAQSERPDVILLDVMMPEMDGPTTLVELKKNPETQHIPVVFLTAKVQKAEVERYLALGAAGVIEKPFDPMALPRQLAELVGS